MRCCLQCWLELPKGATVTVNQQLESAQVSLAQAKKLKDSTVKKLDEAKAKAEAEQLYILERPQVLAQLQLQSQDAVLGKAAKRRLRQARNNANKSC